MSTYLVTGAGSGIGQLVADRLHADGHQLVLVARSHERAHQLAQRWPGELTVVADLAEPASLTGLHLPQRLDGLVHAAGVVELGPVAQLSAEAWTDQLNVNLVAPALLTRAALPALRAARGTVVFVNSGAGLVAHPEWGGYAASKFGLRALADSLRGEEQGHGVRVTSVFPGRTATPMQETVHAQEGKAYDADRWIRPETVADAVVRVLALPEDATMPEVVIRPR